MNWVVDNLPVVGTYLLAHLLQTAPAIAASLLLAVPIAVLAQRIRALRGILVAGSSLAYAVPSLALFVVLPAVLGTGIREPINVVVALTIYGLALLVPATVDAFDAVDPRVLDAAASMGMGAVRRLLTVELPLAGPAMLAALRVVTVSTVSLTTVGAVLGVRSLGWLFTDGFQRGITAEILTGLVATVLLALLLDALVVAAGRAVMPWTRRGARPGDGSAAAPQDGAADAADAVEGADAVDDAVAARGSAAPASAGTGAISAIAPGDVS